MLLSNKFAIGRLAIGHDFFGKHGYLFAEKNISKKSCMEIIVIEYFFFKKTC